MHRSQPRPTVNDRISASQERSAGMFAGRRAVLPLALVLISLSSLALLPMWTMNRTGTLRDRVGIIAEPARAQVTRIQNAIALESAATRAFLLTGDSAAATHHFRARANRDRALRTLQVLTRGLGTDVRIATEVLANDLREVEPLLDSLFSRRVTRAEYLASLPRQEERLEGVLSSAADVDRALGAEVTTALAQARRAETVGAVLTIVFVLMALASAVLVAKLTRQFRDSEERFRQISEAIQDFVWLSDTRFRRYLFANEAYERIWGRSRADLYADPGALFDGVHSEDRDRVRHAFANLQTGPHDIEFRVAQPTGDVRWVWSRAFPIRDARGDVYRIAGIVEDITEQKSVNESRLRLMRGFTHDVKNPLGAADGHLGLLEDGVKGTLTEQQLESVGRGRRLIKAALNLVSQLLDIARAEAGQLQVQREPTDVAQVAEEIVEEFRPAAIAKKQSVALDIPGAGGDSRRHSELVIQSDPARVRQVVANLVSNAVKYTQPDGRIRVTAGFASNGNLPTHETWVAITVSDNGPGIPYEKQNMLFREFTRFNPGAADGSGIGLAISQRIARALHATITFTSKPGAGSSFTLWLPADPVSPQAPLQSE
jgi:PAS domain S-box-containing protein